MKRIIPISLLLAASLMAGETRTWKNSDGTKSFDAEFVSREKEAVTLLRNDGKMMSFSIAMLHREDQRWLNLNHPADGGAPAPDADAVFDTLKFGDSRDTVTTKLTASKMVEAKVASTFFGRTGLNGVFRTKQAIGGLFCYLSFDWDEDGGLKEITLQTESQPAADYPKTIKACWDELIELIGPIHGKPLQGAKFPPFESLGEDQIIASHLWKIEQGGTVLLGTARETDGYQVAVRFTKEIIPVNKTP